MTTNLREMVYLIRALDWHMYNFEPRLPEGTQKMWMDTIEKYNNGDQSEEIIEKMEAFELWEFANA